LPENILKGFLVLLKLRKKFKMIFVIIDGAIAAAVSARYKASSEA